MEDNQMIRDLSGTLYGMKGWLKFIGIVTVIGGIISALSLVGIIFAWVPIWMGITLYKASNKIEMAYNSGDKIQLMEAFSNLKTYFTIQGFLLIISIVLTVFSILLFSSVFMMMFDSMRSSF